MKNQLTPVGIYVNCFLLLRGNRYNILYRRNSFQSLSIYFEFSRFQADKSLSLSSMRSPPNKNDAPKIYNIFESCSIVSCFFLLFCYFFLLMVSFCKDTITIRIFFTPFYSFFTQARKKRIISLHLSAKKLNFVA